MSQSIRERLSSSDPAVRQKAIIALGRSGNPKALPLLHQVYDSDPDPALRDLALRAARHIRRASQPAAPEQTPAPAPVERRPPLDERYAGYEDPAAAAPAYILPVYDEASQPYTTDGYEIVERAAAADSAISAADRTRARALVKRAAELEKEGALKDSLSTLVAALELDAALVDDTATQKLASALIGQEGQQAAAILADPQRRGMYVGHIPERRIERVKRTGGVSWGEVWLDVGIYFVLAVLLSVLELVLTVNFMPGLLETLAVRMGEPLPPEYIALLDPALLSQNLPAVVLGSLGSGVWSVLVVLFMLWLVHLIAAGLGGHGTLTQTYHAVIPVQTALLLLGGVVLALGLFSGVLELLAVGGLLLAVLGIVLPIRALAKAHSFGAVSGCLAWFLGGIATVILLGLLMAALWAVAGASLLSMLPAVG